MAESNLNKLGFYRAFEDKYRGSRELIKSRLKSYLPFTTPFSHIHPKTSILDLGCGRGEWLELMQAEGFEVLGIDMDEGMLEACRKLNLPVTHGDAISFLQNLPNDSLSIISAFHFVEHISFESLQTLIQEALRVLMPGGLIIMETPNPENIRVSTLNFHLDPTHKKPIPPLLLSFCTEHYGFYRSKIVRLQEDKKLHTGSISLLDVLSGVSPDYAVVAQKFSTKKSLRLFDDAFNTNFGLTLEDLGLRVLNEEKIRIEKLNNRLIKLENSFQKFLLIKLIRFFKRLIFNTTESIKLLIKKIGQSALKFSLTKRIRKAIFQAKSYD